jgi:hypothetical protein
MPGKGSPKAKEGTLPDPSFAPVAAAFAGDGLVTSGMMMSSYGLKVGGKIFAMSHKGMLVVKLPKPRVDELVSTGKGKRFDPGHGRLMKEWAVVGSAGPDWVALAREAYRFVRTVAER